MLHIQRESSRPSGEQSGPAATTSRKATPPPFRSKLLPVILSAALGFSGAGFFAFREIARAQPSLQTMPNAASALRAAAGKKASGDLSGRTCRSGMCCGLR